MKNISNKTLVLDFYKKVVKERNSDLIDTYVSDDYIQHSPSMKDGKAGLREAIEYLRLMPKPKEEKSPIVLAIEDGDYVMLLLDLSLMGRHLSVADLFRVVGGKIVEHWDAIQDITSDNITAPEFNVVEGGSKVSERNKTLIRSIFEDDILNKEFSEAVTERKPLKVHRILSNGNVVGVQSEGMRSDKAFVVYDFFNMIDSRITLRWSVEQTIPATFAHNNGMI